MVYGVMIYICMFIGYVYGIWIMAYELWQMVYDLILLVDSLGSWVMDYGS